MEQATFKYLQRIDGYQENKIHRIQAQACSALPFDGNRRELSMHISGMDEISLAHTSDVVDNMMCLVDHDCKPGVIVLDEEIAIQTSLGTIPDVCRKECRFGQNGDIPSGCKLLLDRLYRKRTDTRLTHYDPTAKVVTHYGVEAAQAARKKATSCAPTIELAILETVHKSDFKDSRWNQILGSYLWPIVKKDLKDGMYPFEQQMDAYNSLKALNTALMNHQDTLPNSIMGNAWIPVIREFGIFSVVDVFTNNLYTEFNRRGKGFIDSEHIRMFVRNFYYPFQNNEERADVFRRPVDQNIHGVHVKGDVLCPGRALGTAISLALAYNTDLKFKNIFSTRQDSHVNLVTYDKHGNHHLLQEGEMQEQYNKLVQD